MIPKPFIEDLLSRADIVSVIEQRISLKKAGANYIACCPFHSEKTPSFTVSPTKQFYHCFGCGAHGSAIGFIMQFAGIEYVDAIEELAGNLGIPVPRESSQLPRQDKQRHASLTQYMTYAANYYKACLKKAPQAIAYLKERGLSGEIAARFGLGYAPDDWQPLADVFEDYNDAALAECGLIKENDQGHRYDRFRNRIMFPILDQRSRVIGFGGRVLGDGEPKYLNSPETPLFHKGEELYGLPQAGRSIRAENRVIVVEGYMDVVALAQHGVANVVATLGTATTPNHCRKLLRQAEQLVFCFDGDAAGRKAAWRALDSCLEGLSDDRMVGFLFLPPEHDPDSFIRSEGSANFQQMLGQATTLTEFLMRQLTAEVKLETAEGRARLVHEAKPYLNKLSAPLLRGQLLRTIAAAAALSPEEVAAQCGIKSQYRGRPAPPRSQVRTPPQALERSLLQNVLRHPERAARLPLELINAESAEGAALLALTHDIEHADLPTANLGLLLEHYRGTEHEDIITQLAAQLDNEVEDEGEQESVFMDAIARLRAQALSREIEKLNQKARNGSLSTAERQSLADLLARKKT